MFKYVTRKEIADRDRLTQLAQGYPNIPPYTEVKMVDDNVTNYYGAWFLVEWKGHRYYASMKDIAIVEVKDETPKTPLSDYTLDELLGEIKRRCNNE